MSVQLEDLMSNTQNFNFENIQFSASGLISEMLMLTAMLYPSYTTYTATTRQGNAKQRNLFKIIYFFLNTH